MAIGLTSHFYIRKYRAGWFRKYNVCIGSVRVGLWNVDVLMRGDCSICLAQPLMAVHRFSCLFSQYVWFHCEDPACIDDVFFTSFPLEGQEAIRLRSPGK